MALLLTAVMERVSRVVGFLSIVEVVIVRTCLPKELINRFVGGDSGEVILCDSTME